MPPPLSSFPSREDEWPENSPGSRLVACVGHTTTHHSPAFLPAASCIERFNKLTISTITVNEFGNDCKFNFRGVLLIAANSLELFAYSKQNNQDD